MSAEVDSSRAMAHRLWHSCEERTQASQPEAWHGMRAGVLQGAPSTYRGAAQLSWQGPDKGLQESSETSKALVLFSVTMNGLTRGGLYLPGVVDTQGGLGTVTQTVFSLSFAVSLVAQVSC